jgi:hypothetical protein
LRGLPNRAERRAFVMGQAFQIDHRFLPRCQGVQDLGFARAGHPAEHAHGALAGKLGEAPAPAFFVAAHELMGFEARQVEQPRHGAAAHSAAPAMHPHGVAARQFLRLHHQRAHLGAEEIEPQQHGLIRRNLLIRRPNACSLLIRKQRKAKGPRDVPRHILRRRPHIEDGSGGGKQKIRKQSGLNHGKR